MFHPSTPFSATYPFNYIPTFLTTYLFVYLPTFLITYPLIYLHTTCVTPTFPDSYNTKYLGIDLKIETTILTNSNHWWQ